MDHHLPLVFWTYRSAFQKSSHCSPTALMFGRKLWTPADLVFGAPPEVEELARLVVDKYRQLMEGLRVAQNFARHAQDNAGLHQKRGYDQQCRGQAFNTGEQVWVHCPIVLFCMSPKLQHHWRGPGDVIEQLGEVTYRA